MSVAAHISFLIEETPFLESFLSEGIINHSALAKKMHAKLSTMGVKCTEASVLMAINRHNIPFEHKRKYDSFHFSQTGELSVTSNLTLYRFHKGNVISWLREKLMEYEKDERFFHLLFEAGHSASLVLRTHWIDRTSTLLEGIPILESKTHLSAITIEFSNEEIRVPGLYYMLFKQLAWHNVNVYETSSSGREITLLVDNARVNEVFSLIHHSKIGLF